MKFQKIYFSLLCISSLFLFSSCDDENVSEPQQNTFFINDSVREWISPFDVVNKEFTYLNSDNEEAKVTVIFKIPTSASSFADCQRNGNTFQCEYESVALEFTSDTVTYLTAFLFGEDRLTLNYSDVGGLSPEIIRYQEEERQFEIPQPDNFDVMFQEDYTFNGETNNAFIINTVTLDGLFDTTPPNSFVFLKGIGIVEWTDYAGETWVLSE